MQTIKGDLFAGEWNGMCHIANCFHTWGAGIVVPLKKKYPSAYDADLETDNNHSKLGQFSFAIQSDKRIIFNLYAQKYIGNNKHPLNRNCLYDKVFDSVFRVCEFIETNENPTQADPFVLAFPYMIGCGLAGGSANIVESILKDVEARFSDIKFVVYKL
jgi:hypothetical protein